MSYLQLDRFGAPTDTDTVSLQPQAKPVAAPGHIVVKMMYSTINPSDLFVVQGLYAGATCVLTQKLPSRLGFEGAGVIAEVGEGVDENVFRVGDPIIPLVGGDCGSWASYVTVPAMSSIPVPRDCFDIPFEYLAQVFVNPLTILAMFEDVGIQPGETFLQTAANSSLGRMTIQVAKQKGYKSVNIVRRANLVEDLKQEGGDHVFCFPSDNIVKECKEVTGGKGVKYVFDAVGGKMGSQAIQCLADHGTALIYGLQSGERTPIDSGEMIFKGIQVRGFWLMHWVQKQTQGIQGKMIQELFDLIKQGVVKPSIESTYPLSKYKEAFKDQLNSANGRKGKLLFDLRGEDGSQQCQL